MKHFFAQLNDGGTFNKPADRMEIVNESIRVYDGDKLVAYMDLSTVLYAHIAVTKRDIT